jgi:hypothetical protein
LHWRQGKYAYVLIVKRVLLACFVVPVGRFAPDHDAGKQRRSLHDFHLTSVLTRR